MGATQTTFTTGTGAVSLSGSPSGRIVNGERSGAESGAVSSTSAFGRGEVDVGRGTAALRMVREVPSEFHESAGEISKRWGWNPFGMISIMPGARSWTKQSHLLRFYSFNVRGSNHTTPYPNPKEDIPYKTMAYHQRTSREA